MLFAWVWLHGCTSYHFQFGRSHFFIIFSTSKWFKVSFVLVHELYSLSYISQFFVSTYIKYWEGFRLYVHLGSCFNSIYWEGLHLYFTVLCFCYIYKEGLSQFFLCHKYWEGPCLYLTALSFCTNIEKDSTCISQSLFLFQILWRTPLVTHSSMFLYQILRRTLLIPYSSLFL